MFNLFSRFFKSSQINVSQLIQKLDRTNIASCILGISIITNSNSLNFNISHSALLLLDNCSEENNKDREFGILIEYGNFSPIKSEDENIIYRYGEKGGLRYYSLNYSKFVKDYGTIGYVSMDIESKNKMTFSAFIEHCAPLHENQWTQNKYSLYNNNCHNFIAKALNVLKPEFIPSTIIINCKEPKLKKKIQYFPKCIEDALIIEKNKTDNLGKIINKNKDRNKDENKVGNKDKKKR